MNIFFLLIVESTWIVQYRLLSALFGRVNVRIRGGGWTVCPVGLVVFLRSKSAQCDSCNSKIN